MTTATDHAYRVYIVRCWEDSGVPENSTSRFVLEIPRTGERYGFTSSEKLLNALQNQLELPTHENHENEERGSV
jgi:hypothetical protein